MTSERSDRFRQACALFDAALDRPSETRAAYLQAACGDDDALRRSVAALLRADAAAGTFLGEPVLVRSQDGALSLAPPDTSRVEPAPQTVGPYRVIRRIGQGGMATVYLAARDDDAFHRRVVIKLVRAGMESDDLLERLRRERRILAGLDHPFIARLFDGGATDDGLPYFVLEHVDGMPIDVFCDQNRWTIDQRVALFRKVCDAVHAAHQNLVVHRDLKPSNILVTADGTPKLLDFGIAKVLHPELASTAEPTEVWLRLLTPHYASPEQISGAPVTTASDVYSLGVLLYELLTGELPFRFEDRSPKAIERILTTRTPPPPSLTASRSATASDGTLAAAARARGTTAEQLRRRLSGDLDSIVLRALRTVPQQRYASAAQLGEDLDRFRRQLPVRARSGSWRYRAGKLLRRHRMAVAAALGAMLIATGFVVALAMQASRIARERDRTERQYQQKSQVLALFQDLFQVADPYSGGGLRLTVVEALDRVEPAIERRLAEQPLASAALLHTVGEIHTNLGSPERAVRSLEQALSLRAAALDDRHPDALATRGELARALVRVGRQTAAERQARLAVALTEVNGRADPRPRLAALEALADVLCFTGRYAAAEPIVNEALELARGVAPPDGSLARALGYSGLVALAAGDNRRAADLFRHSFERLDRRLGGDHPSLVEPLTNLGAALRRDGDHGAADSALRRALALQERHLGADHPELAATLNNLASVALDLGDPDLARRRLERARDLLRAAESIDTERLVLVEVKLAAVEVQAGRPQQAVETFRAGLPRWRSLLGPEHWRVADAESRLGAALIDLERFDDAEAHLVRAYRDLLAAGTANRQRSALRRLATLLERTGRSDEIAAYAAMLPAPSDGSGGGR